MVAEAIKHGGNELRKTIVEIVQEAWKNAAQAEKGKQAETWPDAWKVGLMVPLWKRKGDKKDRNTWRGVTLLSVGSKILARIVAARLSKWSEGWISETQSGFRRGRGTDDALQVTRRILEEACRQDKDWYVLAFFDIEKAYPRVCRPALWELMQRRGCPKAMINICKGLHEATTYKVKIAGGQSSGWEPERGLREGCPSSPPLFNVYHDGVMQDFRARQKRNAEEMGANPGIKWAYQVDGRLQKRFRATKRSKPGGAGRTSDIYGREGYQGETRTTVIGDIGFADDTVTVGKEAEMEQASSIFVQTLTEWEEKVNVG